MSGDYTRFTFDPRRRFAGVLMQQGRVQLDSDWNEQTDLLRERTRVLTLDTGGPAWLPILTTPDAFLIGAIAGPPADLSIEPGRIYVDGRLAEIFPDEGVTYNNQPFLLPKPPPLLNPAIDTLVYLDLWEREVTWAEDPRLLDVALGGVDTTTRVQQVWQVKLHEQRGVAATCDVDLNALFPPSAGRLTTSAVAPPAPNDPCILPPNAGYRGIENRLYRVEIHTAGPLGTALFKWSRDDGSIVALVSAIDIAGGQSRITVNRLGRDEVLRFRIDDWVTLTDDYRELNGEAGQMARIVDIVEVSRIIVLDRVVPTAGRAFGTTAAEIVERHTRLQRWDERAPQNAIDADGLMTTGPGPIDLEDGVQVSFSIANPGGAFKVGDYWVFAARTADASVEPLNQAPPRGIRHQYLQLAAIPANAPPQDCRPKPPAAAGCCTIVVAPGESIQDGIKALPDEGGCVCLKAGQHNIDEPIVLDRRNVTIHGESLGAIIFNRRGSELLVIRGAESDRIHTITFVQGEAAQGPVIVIQKCNDIVIDDCRLQIVNNRPASTGIMAYSATDLTISRCVIFAPVNGVSLASSCDQVTVADCDFTMSEVGPNTPINVAILAREMAGPLTAERNFIRSAVNGIIINDKSEGPPSSDSRQSRVADNRIRLVETPGHVERSYGIDVAGEAALILANHIFHDGGRVTGIRICGNGSEVSDNIVETIVELVGEAVGISAGFSRGGNLVPIERILIDGNIIDGSQHGIALTDVSRAEVHGNILGRGGMRFGNGIVLDANFDCTVSKNIVERPIAGVFSSNGARNQFVGNSVKRGEIGVGVIKEEAPIISGNRIEGAAQVAIGAAGITKRCDVIANQAVRCGSEARIASAIFGMQIAAEWHVESNEVVDTGLPYDAGGPTAAIAYGIHGLGIREARIEGNTVSYTSMSSRGVANEDRALRLLGEIEYEIPLGNTSIVFGYAAQIAGNKFTGVGASALVELLEEPISHTAFRRFERVLFIGNYCWHWSGPYNDALATVWLNGRYCTVSSNHVKATTPRFVSYYLSDMPGTVVGNVSTGNIVGLGGGPAPVCNMTV